MPCATEGEQGSKEFVCELRAAVGAQGGRNTVKSEDVVEVKLGGLCTRERGRWRRLARYESGGAGGVVSHSEDEIVAALRDGEWSEEV